MNQPGTDWPARTVQQWAYAALIVLIASGYMMRRLLSSRLALRDPRERASRFFRGHLATAAIGALAVPLGLGYAYATEPRLQGVAPFWIAALGLGALAWPRRAALEGFEEPMSGAKARRSRR
jgi:hypothetical protein